MPTYKAELPNTLPGLQLKNGVNAILIEAVDATDAAALLAGHMISQDDQLWSNATISELTNGADFSPVVNPDTGETNNWVFSIAIAGGTVNATFSHTATAGQDLDAVMAAMVVLLNADANIANAAWATPNLTVADVADNIGDHTVTPTVTYGGTTILGQDGATTDGGIAGAALVQAYSVVVPSFEHIKL